MEDKRSSRWSIAEAKAVLADQASSGLTPIAFCQERGFRVERLYRWRRRLERGVDQDSDDSQPNAHSFVRAELMRPNFDVSGARDSPPTMLELDLRSGHRLRFGMDADPVAIARTVQALEASLC